MFEGIHNVPKRGCRIISCDPSQRLIEAKIQRGEIITINAYALPPLFRWPQVGEMWEVREENGSWILGGIWEEEEDGVGAGDTVINASSGRILLHQGGTLKQIYPWGESGRTAEGKGPFVIVAPGVTATNPILISWEGAGSESTYIESRSSGVGFTVNTGGSGSGRINWKVEP